jgi:putative membrane protein
MLLSVCATLWGAKAQTAKHRLPAKKLCVSKRCLAKQRLGLQRACPVERGWRKVGLDALRACLLHRGWPTPRGKESLMSKISRNIVTAFSVSALCLACGSDQKTAASADDMQPEASTPQPVDVASSVPNGQPVNTPPDNPPPQGLNDSRTSNALASPGATTAPAPQLTEPQIAMITELANTAEVEQGKLAQTKAKNASVKKFAAMMVKHHTEAKTEQSKLFKQLSLTPTQSQDANVLKDGADRTLGTLRGADGAAFDTAYIDSQVDEHQKVLDTIDQKLLPAAKSEDLVNGLKKMRDTVESHLKEAKSIQAELSKTASK